MTGGDGRRALHEVKDLVKECTDLAEVVGRYTKLIKEAGGFKCSCPLPGHKDKTPSFHVNTREKYFYCYGCRRGGDVYTFLELVEGLSFVEALKELASQQGVELPKFEPRSASGAGAPRPTEGGAPTPGYAEAKNRKAAGFELLERAARFYQRLLMESPQGAPALSYLRERGLSDEEIAELKLGWAPEGRATLLSKLPPESQGLAEAVGLVRNFDGRRYDFFQERLMIPISDHRGRTLAFSGRTLKLVDDRNPKYKNSPETDWFKKKTVVYGLDRAARLIRDFGFVAVVEGYFDQWALHKQGVPAVAVMGTALTPEHLDQLLRYTRQIVMVMDTDAAGVAATIKSLPPLLKLDCDVRVFSDLGGKDPAEWLQSFSGDAVLMRKRLMSAPGALEWWADRVLLEARETGLDRFETLRRLCVPWSLAGTRPGTKRVLAERVALLVFGAGTDLEKVAVEVARDLDRLAPKFASPTPVALSAVESSAAMAALMPSRPRLVSASRAERLAEELFSFWIRHWDSLRDEASFALPELRELMAETPAEGFLVALEEFLATSPMPSGAWVRQFLEALPVEHALRPWLLAGLVGTEATSTEISKVLNSFKELTCLLRKERLQGELRRLQLSLKELDSDPEASARILNEIQKVRLRLENAHEPARV